MTQRSVRFLRVGFCAGLHQIEAILDLAQQPRKIAPLLRGEAGQDFLLLAQQARDQFFVKRYALARQAQAEFGFAKDEIADLRQRKVV